MFKENSDLVTVAVKSENNYYEVNLTQEQFKMLNSKELTLIVFKSNETSVKEDTAVIFKFGEEKELFDSIKNLRGFYDPASNESELDYCLKEIKRLSIMNLEVVDVKLLINIGQELKESNYVN